MLYVRSAPTPQLQTEHPVPLYTHRGMLSFGLAVVCTMWSGDTASRIVVRRTPALEGMQTLVFLPCLLCYSAFMMLCVY